MSSSDNNNPSSGAKTARESLLDELQSIKGLLDDNFNDNLNIDIPILDDIVHHSAEFSDANEASSPDIIDLNSIFEDEEKPFSNHSEGYNFLGAGVATSSTIATQRYEQGFNVKKLDIDNDADAEQPASDNSVKQDTSLHNIVIPSFKLNQAIEDNSLLISDDMEPIADFDEPDSLESNLAGHYHEEQEDMFPPPHTDSNDNQTSKPAQLIDMDILIQEIVDEFIPSIEDELRTRLANLPKETIQQLATKYLNS